MSQFENADAPMRAAPAPSVMPVSVPLFSNAFSPIATECEKSFPGTLRFKSEPKYASIVTSPPAREKR
ncbi:MAG: hypothetical protein BWY81_01606 [Firmicutes bacterium ADurb.Bin467]|nr:MAG: hypothetical protein BWY81_01606 [Firmicutes bacterium ADurb.Bin467]